MYKNRQIDEIDYRILKTLQAYGRTQTADIARELGMAPSAVLSRVRKLESQGVIQGYETKVDGGSVGRGLIAFLFITTNEPIGETGVGKKIAEIPEVQEVHVIAGEDCYLVKLRTSSPQELAKLMRERFGQFKSIRSTRTTIVLDTFKETWKMPLTEVKRKQK